MKRPIIILLRRWRCQRQTPWSQPHRKLNHRNYHISKVVPLGPPDRWDYVVFDPDSHRVYVAHGDRVTVVDGDNGAIVGTVEGMPGGTHGIAISHATGKGYTDDGKAGVVVEFDLRTLKVSNASKPRPTRTASCLTRPSGHIFVIDGDSGKLTVIDPKTDTVVATVDGGGGLEFGDTGNNGKFYVDGAEKNEIVRVDTATNMADAHWPMPTCVRPHGLAIDREHHRLFASCSNKVHGRHECRQRGRDCDVAYRRGHRLCVFRSPKRPGL